MPSQLHELHLLLFRNRPALAAQLIRSVLGVELPSFDEARIDSADLTEVQPAEYRADLVIQLVSDRPVYAIVVEAQLSVDDRKRFVWPAYVANLRARLRCPVALLVVTADDTVARWAACTVEIGGLHHFAPYVLGPSRVPEISDEAVARDNPELAVLSAMAHGRRAHPDRAAEIAKVAQKATHDLDADRKKIYFDLIIHSLGEAARQALGNMNARTYEFQSDFARQYIAQGKVELIIEQLSMRFGRLGEEIESRIKRASGPDLQLIGTRLLTARTLDEALG